MEIGDPDTSYLCYGGTVPPCTSVTPACQNVGISLQALGYDTASFPSTYLGLTFNMISLSTALAVNFGMASLENLQQIKGDNDRVTLLKKMVSFGYISQAVADATSTFYDAFYTPASTVYCTDWAQVNDTEYKNLASCFTRVGNTLMYPLIVSSGYFKEGSAMPERCTKASVTDSPSGSGKKQADDAAKYYCNLMNFNIGFIYYPTPDLTSNPYPTLAPTTYTPGSPTMKPTQTKKPTKSPFIYFPGSPTTKPTFGAPTADPTYGAPTQIPTAPVPTPLPTRKPTRVPTKARRNLERTDPDRLLKDANAHQRLLMDSTGIVGGSQSNYTFLYPPPYTATNTNNDSINYVTYSFDVCGITGTGSNFYLSYTYLAATTCYDYSTIGDTYLKLYSGQNMLASNDNSEYGDYVPFCSYLYYYVPLGCNTYEIHQGCSKNTTCSSSTTIYISNNTYTSDDDVSPTPQDDYSFNGHYYSSHYYHSDDGGSFSPVPVNVHITDDYGYESQDDYRGAINDDFVLNNVVEAVDNGMIFSFALVYPMKLFLLLLFITNNY